MATPAWQPTRLYAPGSLVVPRAVAPPTIPDIPNAGFEDGDTGWVKEAETGAQTTIVNSPANAFQGSWCVRFATTSGGTPTDRDGSVHMADPVPMAPGGRVSLTGMLKVVSGGSGASAAVVVQFLNASDLPISVVEGSVVTGVNGSYRQSTVTNAVAPAGTAKVRAAIYFNDSALATEIYADSLSWTYTPPANSSLQYKAVQPATGYSAADEPVWPTTLGLQVIDNEVIWEAVSLTRVVWQASPVLKTGPDEPTWPLDIGGEVADGTVKWRAVDPITSDDNCPHTRVVAIAKFKIFAADKDVVRFTATLAPQDWTSTKDAGYLGVGLNQGSANHVALLNLYRANLVVMNSVMFQQWQVDPDPQLMDMLDRMDGIGSSWHLAAAPVADDLFYLSSRGVRTVGVSGATNNLKSGDIGLPVDPIISALTNELVARNAAGANEQPLGMYLPGMGQYWLSYNRIVPPDGDDGPEIGSPRDLCPTLNVGDRYAEVMVYTITQVGQVGAWSRYVFPFAIDDWTQEGDDLFVRDGERVFRLSEDLGAVDFYLRESGGPGEFGEPFDALIQWPWLDMGRPGQDKHMLSFDFVGYGEAEIEFGFDQSEPGYFTDPYAMPADTLPAQEIPMELTAPSYSVRVRYHGWDPEDPETDGQRHWSFNALAINYQ